MSIIGLGVDIIQVSRFKSLLTKSGGAKSSFADRLARRVLHPTRELPEFEQLRSQQSLEPCVRYISGSWAAKEALYKTLDYKDQKGFQFNNWYRYRNESNKPFISSDVYTENEEFLLSISHDGGMLVATVLRQLKN